MEQGLTIRENTKEITGVIQETNTMQFSVLTALGLPTDAVLSTIDERKVAIGNLPHIIEKLDEQSLVDAYYLSKFFVAVTTGLFDAALNYLWDETIKQLRIRIINGDIRYFYDVVLSDNRRKIFSGPDDLSKLDDFDLIKGALEIDLISMIGYRHLDYIRYMRNWASAAHPNQTELTGLNLVSWLEICIKEVISIPPSSIQVRINQLLSNIKTETIDTEQAETIAMFFTELNSDKANALAKGLFGIYIDPNTTQQTRTNINLLAPDLWQVVSEEIKSDFGIRYATFITNGDNQAKGEAKRFLEMVDGMSYLPDPVKVPQIKTAIENLVNSHNGLNNFYNEPSFAQQLKSIVGTHGNVPPQLDYSYVKALVFVFISNGNGVAWNANPMYVELIKGFDPKQAFIAMTSFLDKGIKSKLQFSLCKQKFEEMLDYIQPNITSEGLLELLQEIKTNINALFLMKSNDRMVQKIKYFSDNYPR